MRISVHERLVTALRERISARACIRDAWTCGSESVVLLIDAPSPCELHLLLLAPYPLFWLRPAARRRAAGTGFGEWLARHVIGASISQVSSGRSGRILRLDLENLPATAGGIAALVLDPGTNSTRFLALSAAGTTEQRYPPPHHGRASGRARPGEPYEEPQTGFMEPWERAAFASDETPAGIAMRAPGDPPASARAGLAVCAPAQPLAAGASSVPRIFLSPLASAAGAAIPWLTLSGPQPELEAAEAAGRLWVQMARSAALAGTVRQTLDAEAKHLLRLHGRLRDEVEEAGGGTDLRRQAEALLASAIRIPRGAREIEVPDPSAAGRTIRVSLDPALGLGGNAARLFQRAARLERALPARRRKAEEAEQLAGRIVAARERLPEHLSGAPDVDLLIADLAAPAAGLESGLRQRWERLIRRLREARAALEEPLERGGYEARRSRAAAAETRAPRAHAAPRGQIHPRRFTLPGGWVVLVARSRQENDVLTHRLAAPHDLWFHAQGVAGSHVILRRGRRQDNPSRAILEMTAAIAAFHSKARTSGMAPVIYTEKRYVRKPRKSAPGLATCTRERTLMVVPRLPEGEAAQDTSA